MLEGILLWACTFVRPSVRSFVRQAFFVHSITFELCMKFFKFHIWISHEKNDPFFFFFFFFFFLFVCLFVLFCCFLLFVFYQVMPLS